MKVNEQSVVCMARPFSTPFLRFHLQQLAIALRRGAYELHFPSQLLHSACPAGKRAAYVARFATTFHPMRAALPQSVHMLTLAPRGRGLEEVACNALSPSPPPSIPSIGPWRCRCTTFASYCGFRCH